MNSQSKRKVSGPSINVRGKWVAHPSYPSTGRFLPRRISARTAYLTGFRDGAAHAIAELQHLGALPRW